MTGNNAIRYLTFLLAFCAGFSDTTTFVSADELFSAHVTGNFIVFAYDVVKGADAQAWVKLMSFPVFIISVMTGGRIAARSKDQYRLLIWEGILLVISGAIIWVLNFKGNASHAMLFGVSMIIVFAMGLQNAFGRIYAKETFGPTTIMTGNVTQLSLDAESFLRSSFHDTTMLASLKKHTVTIGGFLVGCLTGGISAHYVGLTGILIPGILLLFMASGIREVAKP
ncbi:MAG: YoaK family protein [Chitinophagaceae bacterium]